MGAGPAPVQAQGDLSIVSSSALAQFPASLTFSLEAKGPAAITDVRLSYSVERDSFARVVTEIKPAFSQSTDVSTSWVWDMRQGGGFPSGTVVDYWWTVADASGGRLTSAIEHVSFDDTRYSWQSIQGGNITLYWYSGDKAFAQSLMTSAQQGLTGLEQSTGAHLIRPVRVFIYGSAQDLLGAMIFPQEWTGGATYPQYSTIVIGIATSQLDWGKGAMVHELAHMVNYQITRNPYSGLPTWLDEGLATYAQGLDSNSRNILVSALSLGSLISVRSLCSPFSADPNQTYLSYAESFSLVDYLVSAYGQAKMLELMTTFSRGSGYDEALLAVYGFDIEGLGTRWQAWASQKYLTQKAGVTA